MHAAAQKELGTGGTSGWMGRSVGGVGGRGACTCRGMDVMCVCMRPHATMLASMFARVPVSVF
eukprot:352428-Chlamydomonas_euryale.AAC.14